jgi:DNA-binding NtrC family response regulator
MAHRNARALILGETGTGKELLARAIHAGSPRSGAPFVAVNCSAFPEHLIESELFGHERGSFTDAHSAKPGLFEMADNGTLFLDEIGDLPLSLQAKLLRVLEDGQIRRVGATRSRNVDVRILAATNDALPERVRQGRFREDLFFRLSAVVLRLPPLRERGDDVILVAEALLTRLAVEHQLPVPRLREDVRHRLRSHSWPGNIRELKNALERALLLSPPGALAVSELLAEPAVQRAGPIPFPARLHEITTAAVQATVRLCSGNRSESARRLGISPRRLRRLLNGSGGVAWDLDHEDGAEPSDWPGPAAPTPLN